MRPSLFSLIVALILATGCQQQPQQDYLDQPREAVLQSGAGILPVLQKSLGDSDPLIQGKAAIRLGLWVGHKGTPEQKAEVVQALALALESAQIEGQLAILEALGEIGPEAVKPLAKGLEGEDPELRTRTVTSVIKAAQGGAVKAAMDSDDSATMVELLQKAFQDDDPQVRAVVVHGIGFLGTRGTALKIVPVQDPGSQIDLQGREFLVGMLERGLNDEAVEVCRNAGVSAWQFGSEIGWPMLEKALDGENSAARRGALLAIADLPVEASVIGRLGPGFAERDRPSPEELAKAQELLERGFRDDDLLVRLAAAEAAIVLEGNAVRQEAIADIGKAAALGDSALWQKRIRNLADQVAKKGTSEQKTILAQQLANFVENVDRSTAEDGFVVLARLGPTALPVLEQLIESDRADIPVMAVNCVSQMFDGTRRGYESPEYETNFDSDDEAEAMGVIEQALKIDDLELQLCAVEAGMKLRSQPPPAGIVSAIEMALRSEGVDVSNQLPRIKSVANYLGKKGKPDQKAAILQAIESIGDDAGRDRL
jgi:HEAT repeat protein